MAALFTTPVLFRLQKLGRITRGEATRLINKRGRRCCGFGRQRDDFRKGLHAGATNLLPSEIKANNVGELEKLLPTSRLSRFTVPCMQCQNPLTR